MLRSKYLNMQLRSFVLQHAIRQEHLTAEILRLIFRILKHNTRTFGNSGSAVSFQNKIDFLSDLGEIEMKDYPHFRKILEIRNQFAHNPRCVSFEALSLEKKGDYTKYLFKNFPNKEENLEKSLLKSYISLFKHCHKLLCNIRKLYITRLGIDLEMWQSYELLNNRFNEWFNDSQDDLNRIWEKNNLSNSIFDDLKINIFKITLDAFKYKYFADIVEGEKDPVKLWEKVYNRKAPE